MLSNDEKDEVVKHSKTVIDELEKYLNSHAYTFYDLRGPEEEAFGSLSKEFKTAVFRLARIFAKHR
jgi:hypothetical protein